MSVDLKKLGSLRFEGIAQTVSRRDTMLYALGVGVGADPCDERQLRFVYEKNLLALPTMAITLAFRACVLERDVIVLDRGRARIR